MQVSFQIFSMTTQSIIRITTKNTITTNMIMMITAVTITTAMTTVITIIITTTVMITDTITDTMTVTIMDTTTTAMTITTNRAFAIAVAVAENVIPATVPADLIPFPEALLVTPAAIVTVTEDATPVAETDTDNPDYIMLCGIPASAEHFSIIQSALSLVRKCKLTTGCPCDILIR